ncbi:hypothetical protein OHD26_10680, partial [Escherichia coli]|nr:hypothetical protein [Escherichia coli]
RLIGNLACFLLSSKQHASIHKIKQLQSNFGERFFFSLLANRYKKTTNGIKMSNPNPCMTDWRKYSQKLKSTVCWF